MAIIISPLLIFHSQMWHNGYEKRDVVFGFSLKDKTSFKIGGEAEVYFAPKTYKTLIEGLNFFADCNIPISVLGGGTNLLISDSGIDGVVLSLENFKAIKKLNANKLEVQAGVLTEELSKFSVDCNLAGFENFAYLPGTIAGAIFMNARCYDAEISTNLVSVKTLKFTNKKFFEHKYIYNKSDWDYKKSPFQNYRSAITLKENAEIIISAIFNLKISDKKILEETRQLRINDRKQKGHFLMPSCGSTFKNNRKFGKPSGAIIDELGLKGLTVGDAEVAQFHANFIVNKGNASSEDVRNLIQKIQTIVKKEKGFDLEPEVIFVGKDI